MKRNRIFLVASWIAVAVCMGVIFYLSAQNAEQSQFTSNSVRLLFNLEISDEVIRKCAHCLEFAGLAVLVFNALYQSFGYIRPFIAFAITAAYAVSDETHQLFVEGRAFQISDLFIDCFGAALGISALWAAIIIFSKIKRRRFR
ncbi:MAG: VanZ family protein [Clostridia bacterium]|nr:VanZ family protein [Clostridia bacterium]